MHEFLGICVNDHEHKYAGIKWLSVYGLCNHVMSTYS